VIFWIFFLPENSVHHSLCCSFPFFILSIVNNKTLPKQPTHANMFTMKQLMLGFLALISSTSSFSPQTSTNLHRHDSTTALSDMKRPILDQVATALFRLENARVDASSEPDEKGRVGEPMEWSESDSTANKFSELVSANPLGYRFKQWVADIVAGEFDEEKVGTLVDSFVADNTVAMFSFTTCPFCRRAKDFLEEKQIPYVAMELDELDDNLGNEIRALLGKKTKRTSVPSIFIGGEYIGGCNDGPGLLTIGESGKLDEMLTALQ
jgi:glutaredoxin 3